MTIGWSSPKRGVGGSNPLVDASKQRCKPLFSRVCSFFYLLQALNKTISRQVRAELCISTLGNASKAFPSIHGAIIHSDRGSKYTSASYRAELDRCGIIQSMNSDGGRCHDNARCEAMWARRNCCMVGMTKENDDGRT